MKTRFTRAQLLEDIEFLEWRARMAGGFQTGTAGLRSWGRSSNELVHFAYTGEHDGTMPLDLQDLGACVRALAMLPGHRRTRAVDQMYEKCASAARARRREGVQMMVLFPVPAPPCDCTTDTTVGHLVGRTGVTADSVIESQDSACIELAGAWRRITTVEVRRDIYNIYTSDGSVLRCAEAHPVRMLANLP